MLMSQGEYETTSLKSEYGMPGISGEAQIVNMDRKDSQAKLFGFPKIGVRSLTLIFLIFQICILFFLFQLPNPADALRLQLTYSPETFKSIVLSWSDGDRVAYLNHYYFDFIHPLIYGTLLVLFIKGQKSPMPNALFLLPVAGALGDWIENICDLVLVLNFDSFSKRVLWLGATASWTKWATLILTILIFVPKIQRKILRIQMSR